MSNARKRYVEAVTYMDNVYPFISTQVLNIGSPLFDDPSVDTACVAIIDENIQLIISDRFVSQFEVKDYGFVLSHETMHVLLSHLILVENYDSQIKFNIATDCIINDFLISYAIPHTDELPIMHGMDIVGFDCSTADLDDVYNAIPDDVVEKYSQYGTGGTEGGGFDDHNWKFVDGNGNELSSDEAAAALGKILNDQFDKMSPEAKDLAFDNNSDVAKAQGENRPSNGWGNEALTPQLVLDIPDDVSMNWVSLVNTITPDTFKTGRDPVEYGRTFARPNKKLMSQYPRVVLPQTFYNRGGVGNNDKGENTYVIALDCSGSIQEGDKKKFIALAKSLPKDKLNIMCCTFSTYYREFDLDKDNQGVASGGTAFGAIQHYINDCVIPAVGHYPKAVIVITDGFAQLSGTTNEQLENWHWLITANQMWGYQRDRLTTSDNRVNHVCRDQIYDLDDFVL